MKTSKKLLLSLFFIGFTFLLNNQIFAQECMQDWENRIPLTLDNSAGDALTDYQIQVILDTETPIMMGLMEADGRDLRVTNGTCCEPLCYFIESGINTTETVIWVKVPEIGAGETIDLYAFIGNPDADPVSDPACTFAFYEGFDDADFNLEYLCGGISDSAVFEGDFNLSWTASGMLGSNSTFPVEEVFTAEVKMNSISGNWPAIYWAKESSKKNYSLMGVADQARISLTGGGSDWCSGHNWASPLVGYTDPEGVWSFTWIETGSLVGNFPTAGEILSSNDLYAKDEDLRLAIGGISSGAGSMNMDWIRVRKYAAIPPTLEVGDLGEFSPAGTLDLPSELLACEEGVLDAGEGYILYDWSSGGDEQIETILADGWVYLTVTDDEGCEQTDSVDVSIGESFYIEEGYTICSGESFVFPDGTVIESILDEISYTSEFMTAEFGCDSNIVTTIDVYELTPLLDLGEDISNCGDTVFLDAGPGFASYDWSDGDTDQIDTVTSSGLYTLTVIDANGCTQFDNIGVTITNLDNGTSTSGFTISSNQEDATYQWLDCSDDYTIIDGETNMEFMPSENGNYAVEVSIGECVDTSACVAITGMTIQENSSAKFSVYPNPTTGLFNVDLLGVSGELQLVVSSSDGQIILSHTVAGNQILTLDLPLANGIYFVEVIQNESNQTLRLIKQ